MSAPWRLGIDVCQYEYLQKCFQISVLNNCKPTHSTIHRLLTLGFKLLILDPTAPHSSSLLPLPESNCPRAVCKLTPSDPLPLPPPPPPPFPPPPRIPLGVIEYNSKDDTVDLDSTSSSPYGFVFALALDFALVFGFEFALVFGFEFGLVFGLVFAFALVFEFG